MFTAWSSPDALIANRMTGKRNGKISCAGWRTTRRNARRPSTETCSNMPGWATPSGAALLAVIGLARAFQLAAGLGEEDVVERGLVHLQLGELHSGAVERPDHVGELGVAVGQRHGH